MGANSVIMRPRTFRILDFDFLLTPSSFVAFFGSPFPINESRPHPFAIMFHDHTNPAEPGP